MPLACSLAALLENLRGAWTESGSRPASRARDWFFSDSEVLGLALDCNLFSIFSFSCSRSSFDSLFPPCFLFSLSAALRLFLRLPAPPFFFFLFLPGSEDGSPPAGLSLLLRESRRLPDPRRPRRLGLRLLLMRRSRLPSFLRLASSRSILNFLLPRFSMTLRPRLLLLLRPGGGGVLCLGGRGSGVTVSSRLDLSPLGGGGVLGDLFLLLGGNGSGVFV